MKQEKRMRPYSVLLLSSSDNEFAGAGNHEGTCEDHIALFVDLLASEMALASLAIAPDSPVSMDSPESRPDSLTMRPSAGIRSLFAQNHGCRQDELSGFESLFFPSRRIIRWFLLIKRFFEDLRIFSVENVVYNIR